MQDTHPASSPDHDDSPPTPEAAPPPTWDPGVSTMDRWLDEPPSVELSQFLAALRLTRPDGSQAFGPRLRSADRLARLRVVAERLGDPGLATVMNWWLPRPTRELSMAPPPLPSFAHPERPLAALRPDWTPAGDLVAVDHRSRGDEARVEVSSRGRTWVGPSWRSGPEPARFGKPKLTSWTTGAFADCAEWSYRTDAGRVTRTAVLLRGRGLALLAEQRRGKCARQPSAMRLGLPDGIEPLPVAGSRMLTLSAGRGRPSARACPIGLPPVELAPGPGSFTAEGRELVLHPASTGRRAWLPLLISWGKPPTTWRQLTVSEKSKTCPPHVAVGYRVAWGPGDDQLLIYRSLAPVALRAVLGHQTRARFLIGSFNRSGDVRPILKLD